MANIAEAKAFKDIINFILIDPNSLWVSSISLNKSAPILVDNYFDNIQKIATYLTILRQPLQIDTKKFNAFKKKPLNLKIQDNHFSCQNNKNVLIC